MNKTIWRASHEICPDTGKKCLGYREAHETVNAAKHSHRGKHVPTRVYYCESCGLWHLTSMSYYIDTNKRRGKR